MKYDKFCDKSVEYKTKPVWEGGELLVCLSEGDSRNDLVGALNVTEWKIDSILEHYVSYMHGSILFTTVDID